MSISPLSPTMAKLQEQLICIETGMPFSAENRPCVLDCCGATVGQLAIQGLNNNCPNNRCKSGRFTGFVLNDKLLAITNLFQTLQRQLQAQLGFVLPSSERSEEKKNVLNEEKKVNRIFRYEDVSDIAGEIFVEDKVYDIKFGDPNKKGVIYLRSSGPNNLCDLEIVSFPSGEISIEVYLNKKLTDNNKLLQFLERFGIKGEYSLGGRLVFNSVKSIESEYAKNFIEHLFKNNAFPPDVKTLVSTYLSNN
ncbi:MAG: hypothetical protein V4487_07805 [Chlamydiota bacterium]